MPKAFQSSISLKRSVRFLCMILWRRFNFTKSCMYLANWLIESSKPMCEEKKDVNSKIHFLYINYYISIRCRLSLLVYHTKRKWIWPLNNFPNSKMLSVTSGHLRSIPKHHRFHQIRQKHRSGFYFFRLG